MKCKAPDIAALVLVLSLGAGIATAQSTKTPEPLGDVARQLKAQRVEPKQKSKLFTTDDLSPKSLPSEHSVAAPAPADASTPPKEAKPEEKPAEETSGKEAEKESAKAAPAKEEEATHGEKYFSGHMSKLQERLSIDERELSVLEQKLGQNQMMYYPDPNKGLLQQSGPTAMSDVRKLQDQIAKKRAEVAADQQAIEALREQLRREGGDAGWLR